MDSYLIGQPELLEALMRAYGLKGDLPDRLVSPIQLMVELDNLRDVEYRRLRRWGLVSGGDSVAAVAAQVTFSGVVPQSATSRGICVVEQLTINNPTAGALTYFIGLGQNVLTGSNLGSCRDDRQQTPSPGGSAYRGLFGVRSGTSALNPLPASAGDNYCVLVPPAGSVTIPINAVLTGNPNDVGGSVGFFAMTTVANVASSFGWMWRERVAIGSELV